MYSKDPKTLMRTVFLRSVYVKDPKTVNQQKHPSLSG